MTSHGRGVIALTSARQILELEGATGAARFAGIDAFLDALCQRMLDGSSVGAWKLDGAKLVGVSHPWMGENLANVLGASHSRDAVQGRGAWFLPERGPLQVGWLSLCWFIDQDPRFALGNARAVEGSVGLDTVDRILTWALANRLAVDLFYPFAVRGPRAGKDSLIGLNDGFDRYDLLLSELGLDARPAVDSFRPGSGWSGLRSDDQIERRIALRSRLGEAWHPGVGALWRACLVRELASRYYEKADRSGRALRRRVVTKASAPQMVGLFGGDWLAFLGYLGEEPHPDEEILTALPIASFYVAGTQQVVDAAADAGVPVSEVQRIAAALLGTETPAYPIEERISSLTALWTALDQAHDAQQSGMDPLPDFSAPEFVEFHLVDDGYGRGGLETRSSIDSLGSEIDERVRALWGTAVVARWPDRLYSAVLPYATVAAALGPALEFWHGVGLTTWYIAEGPSSRTDVSGMQTYYRQSLNELERIGAPVDPTFFTALSIAEGRLGAPEPIERIVSSGEGIEMTISTGSRRDGFHYLRDVVTLHRRAWTARHLTSYLQLRWQQDLQSVHDEHHRRIADRGKAPTLRQFASIAESAANRWFGGDLDQLYAAIGEKSLVDPVYERLMPPDAHSVAQAVFVRLGGRPLSRFTDASDVEDEQSTRGMVYNAADAARGALSIVQLKEAIGRDPTIAEYGSGRWRRFASLFGVDEAGAGDDAAWSRFLALVAEVLGESSSGQAVAPADEPQRNSRTSYDAPESSNDPHPTRRGWLDRLRGS